MLENATSNREQIAASEKKKKKKMPAEPARHHTIEQIKKPASLPYSALKALIQPPTSSSSS